MNLRKYPDGTMELEQMDIIRMNQLMRGQIDLVGFSDSYQSLPAEEHVALLCHLHFFAQQAGGRKETFRDAVAAARFQGEHLLVRLLASFRGDFSREVRVTPDTTGPDDVVIDTRSLQYKQ